MRELPPTAAPESGRLLRLLLLWLGAVPADPARTSRGVAEKRIRIEHQPSGELIAEGPIGLFGANPFEGNYYISRSCLKIEGFHTNWIPGLCLYKFLYVWLDFVGRDGHRDRMLGWRYILPNPLFFFIFLRIAVPQQAPDLSVRTWTERPGTPSEHIADIGSAGRIAEDRRVDLVRNLSPCARASSSPSPTAAIGGMVNATLGTPR